MLIAAYNLAPKPGEQIFRMDLVYPEKRDYRGRALPGRVEDGGFCTGQLPAQAWYPGMPQRRLIAVGIVADVELGPDGKSGQLMDEQGDLHQFVLVDTRTEQLSPGALAAHAAKVKEESDRLSSPRTASRGWSDSLKHSTDEK